VLEDPGHCEQRHGVGQHHRKKALVISNNGRPHKQRLLVFMTSLLYSIISTVSSIVDKIVANQKTTGRRFAFGKPMQQDG
jgi:hypothetical protein